MDGLSSHQRLRVIGHFDPGGRSYAMVRGQPVYVDGRVIVNVLPLPISLLTSIDPPCISANLANSCEDADSEVKMQKAK